MWLEYLQNGIYPSKGRLAVGKVNPAYTVVSYWLWIEIILSALDFRDLFSGFPSFCQVFIAALCLADPEIFHRN